MRGWLVAACLGTWVPVLASAEALATEHQARHLLNRLAFGARPGEAEALAAGGKKALATWIEGQLHPKPIKELDGQLQTFPTLGLAIPELQAAYPQKPQGFGAADRRPARILEELASAKLHRAVASPNQLEEVLVDFWFNHFNVDWSKGECRWFTTRYEQDAIRPHVFGRFRDMLGATAAHPAMLWYLDNWMSVREGFEPRRSKRSDSSKPKAARGLNENYARELMELHTLGVDGGYTQKDVREVARCFTGLTLDQPREAARAHFRPAAHDRGRKVVLGQTIAFGDSRDMEAVLDLLARHPSTARFLATKLCRRFVSDRPPEALIDRLARVFQQSDGRLLPVYEALFASPEFWQSAGQKTRTPLEFVVATLRALDADPQDLLPLTRLLERMGQPLYRSQPPTGYKDAKEAWVSTGALVNRMRFGLLVGAGRQQGLSWQAPDTLMEPDPERWARQILPVPLTGSTREAIHGELGEDAGPEQWEARKALLVGLLLGSPEFQQR